MIVCTGSEAEMCGRERSRECVRERTPTHPSASLYSASAAVANATLRSVVDTCKLVQMQVCTSFHITDTHAGTPPLSKRVCAIQIHALTHS